MSECVLCTFECVVAKQVAFLHAMSLQSTKKKKIQTTELVDNNKIYILEYV